MKKEQAINELQRIRAELTGTPLEIDDGADTGDARQNSAFTFSRKKIYELRDRAASIDVDGVSSDTLDQLWNDSFKNFPPGWFNPNVPEDLYSQTVEYINIVLAYLNK